MTKTAELLSALFCHNGASMYPKLCVFLRENGEQIIENWLGGTELAPVADEVVHIGEISYEAVAALFEATLNYLENPRQMVRLWEPSSFFVDINYRCDRKHPVCTELFRAGHSALRDALSELTADSEEFTREELHLYESVIHDTVGVVLQQQVHHCSFAQRMDFCPFDLADTEEAEQAGAN